MLRNPLHRAAGLSSALLLVAACQGSSSEGPPAGVPSTATTASATPVSPGAAPEASAVPTTPAPSNASTTVASLPEDWLSRPMVSTRGVVPRGDKGNVENGSVFEIGHIAVDRVARIRVPKTAKVETTGGPGVVYVAVEKTLAFKGHPPGGMSLDAVRANLAVAAKTEGDALSLGTVGEWQNKEGRASVNLIVRVPTGTKIDTVAELGGSDSLASDGTNTSSTGTVGHWYASTSVGSGWQKLTLEPDPRHLASAPPSAASPAKH